MAVTTWFRPREQKTRRSSSKAAIDAKWDPATGIFGSAKPEADLIGKHLLNLWNANVAAAFRQLGLAVSIGFLAFAAASPATADEIVAFYFHSLGVSSQGRLYFPHAFVTIDAAPGLGESSAFSDETGYPLRSFGFVSLKPGPILLLHHTRGEVIDSAKGYLAMSHREFAVRVSDARYQSLLDAVAAWRSAPGDPYDLRHRNCVTFVAAMARAIGLDVGDDRTLDPMRFLTDLRRRNMALIAPDAAPNLPPVRVAASKDSDLRPRTGPGSIPVGVTAASVAGPMRDEKP